MAFDRSKEPSFQTKAKVIKNTNFYNAAGENQAKAISAGSTVTVFEVKEINDQIFYRVGGQNEWLPKSATDWGAPKDSERYNVAIKDGLAIAKNSKAPTNSSDLLKLFKHGNTFPAGINFQWVNLPDTSQSKYTNAKIKVIFPDGSTKERTVHYNITAGKVEPKNKSNLPKKSETAPIKLVNPKPGDLDFTFVERYKMLNFVEKNVNEAILLYEQALYKQISNTIRQGLEIVVDQLLMFNKIVLSNEWRRANLSNKLGYIAYLRILPQKIMDVCFSIKNYGNIGSHHNREADFNKASALADLQQYHDLLVYLVNTYDAAQLTYADVQISDDQNKHPNWYRRKDIDPNKVVSFAQYMYQKAHPQPKITPPVQNTTPAPAPEPVKPKMGKGMKLLITCFALLGVVIAAGIGYEIYRMTTNSNQTAQTAKTAKSSIKEEARNLTTRQDIALSIIYANKEFNDEWQNASDLLTQNNYNIGRYTKYKFRDASVQANGHNYIYVVERNNLGLSFRDKRSGDRLAVFFNSQNTDGDPVSVYTYQMLKEIKQAGQVGKMNSLAKKIIFSDYKQN